MTKERCLILARLNRLLYVNIELGENLCEKWECYRKPFFMYICTIMIILYRYTELRTTNQKMTRQLGEKDEQLQEMRQKVDSVSLELRKSEKAKREVICGVLYMLL